MRIKKGESLVLLALLALLLDYQFVVLAGEDGHICQLSVAVEKSPLLVW